MSEELPVTLGICRRCTHMKRMVETTLDGGTARRIYYCRIMMHETDGTTECNNFIDRR